MLDQVTDYFLTKEKDSVNSVFTVNGFGFAGRGQNTGIAFVSLKPWDERGDASLKVPAIAGRAMQALGQIKDAMVFPFNLPAIIELGNATGFDFQLIDQGNLGHEKLTAARNQLFGMIAQHPDTLVGVRPNGLEDTPQYKLIIDQEKRRRLVCRCLTSTPRWVRPGRFLRQRLHRPWSREESVRDGSGRLAHAAG